MQAKTPHCGANMPAKTPHGGVTSNEDAVAHRRIPPGVCTPRGFRGAPRPGCCRTLHGTWCIPRQVITGGGGLRGGKQDSPAYSQWGNRNSKGNRAFHTAQVVTWWLRPPLSSYTTTYWSNCMMASTYSPTRARRFLQASSPPTSTRQQLLTRHSGQRCPEHLCSDCQKVTGVEGNSCKG